MNTQNRILIVDDSPTNLLVIDAALENYQRLTAESGEEALRVLATAEKLPDLILLDVIMPGLDGFETCRRIKADSRTADIPVIFLTAESDRDHIRKGFDSGGADYVTKPFDHQELRLRVQNHLMLYMQKRDLLRANNKLIALEKQRDDLVHMIAHDMRSPLQAIAGNLELIQLDCTDLSEQMLEDLRDCTDAVKTIEEMINSMLLLSRMESGNLPLNRVETDAAELLRQTLKRYSAVMAGRTVTTDVPAAPLMAACDATMITRVMTNFLDNAIKYTPDTAPMHLTLSSDGATLYFAVKDSGVGIAPEHQKYVFEKFARLDVPALRGKKSFGIGLAFCRMAIESHGGQIGVDSDGIPGRGSTFWFRLPLLP